MDTNARVGRNIAIIVAGGSGSRMRQDIPMQFIDVLDKPDLT